MYALFHVSPFTKITYIWTLPLPLQTSSFLRAIWDVLSQAIALTLPQIKLNSQLFSFSVDGTYIPKIWKPYDWSELVSLKKRVKENILILSSYCILQIWWYRLSSIFHYRFNWEMEGKKRVPWLYSVIKCPWKILNEAKFRRHLTLLHLFYASVFLNFL